MNTQLSPVEIRERLFGLNRRQRRAACRDHWNQMQPWRDPEYAGVSRAQAREASWQAYWSEFKADNLKTLIERDQMREIAGKQMAQYFESYPAALQPIFRFVGRLWKATIGRFGG